MCAEQNNDQGGQPVADVLTVGQGIAGSLLAWTLHRRGLRVLVADDGHKTSASVVAAGMINPVQGQRLNTIWEIAKCLPAAMAMYHELEAQFGQRFFFPRTILKLLKTAEEAQILQTRLQDPAFTPYLGAIYAAGHHSATAAAAEGRNTANEIPKAGFAPHKTAEQATACDRATTTGQITNTTAATGQNGANAHHLHDPFGSFEIVGGGYLDTQSLLGTLRDFFRSENLLIEERLCHADLDLGQPDCVRWRGRLARRIVFAEGWRVLDNPFFAPYAFIPTKGQILTVRAAEPLPEFVVNRGKWLVPQGVREAWIGATFERGCIDSDPTAAAEAEILTQVQSFMPENLLQPRAARAGVRLAAPDHIPRIGFLATEPRVGLFCAFSSKGNCLAPYLANCMAEHIVCGKPLPARANIATKKLKPRRV